MRVNMDSSIANDPRFKKLAKRTGVDFPSGIGRCYLVWLAAYDRRETTLPREDIDIAADLDGFASALVAVGLAEIPTRRQGHDPDAELCPILLHGVEERVAFLIQNDAKASKGGKASGKARRAKAQARASEENEADGKAKGSDSFEPYSPDQDQSLAQDQDLAQAPGDPSSPAAPKATGPRIPEQARWLAQRLASHIFARQPDYLHLRADNSLRTLDRWAHAFRLAHSRDGRDWRAMAELLDWSQSDSFWRANVLSGETFREQYDKLVAAKAKGKGGTDDSPSGDDLRAEAARLRGQGQ